MSTPLIRLAAIGLPLLLLAGCQTAAELRAADETKCRSYGFRPGTDAFASCLQRIDRDRRADFRAMRHETNMWDPWDRPTIVYMDRRRR